MRHAVPLKMYSLPSLFVFWEDLSHLHKRKEYIAGDISHVIPELDEILRDFFLILTCSPEMSRKDPPSADFFLSFFFLMCCALGIIESKEESYEACMQYKKGEKLPYMNYLKDN